MQTTYTQVNMTLEEERVQVEHVGRLIDNCVYRYLLALW